MLGHVASGCCYFTLGPLYAREVYIYISCHVLYLLLKTLWRTIAVFRLQVVRYALLSP